MKEQNNNLYGQRLKTQPRGSAYFFLAIVLTPVGLISPFVWPGNIWSWVWSIAGITLFMECLRQLYVKYDVTLQGLMRRSFRDRAEILWSEIEVITKREIKSRFGIEGILIGIYSPDRLFSIRLKSAAAEDFVHLLATRCPHALWIDDYRGTFAVPPEVNSEHIRSLVARHSQRLRVRHCMAIVVKTLILIAYCSIRFWNHSIPNVMTWAGTKSVVISAGIILLFISGNLMALWRLRK